MRNLRIRYLLAITAFSLMLMVFNVQYLVKEALRIKYQPDYVKVDQHENELPWSYLSDTNDPMAKNTNYVDAITAYKRKDFSVAIEELNEEIRKYPTHAEAYFLLGRIYEVTSFPEGKYFARMLDNYERYILLKPGGKGATYAKLRVAQYYVQAGLKQRNVEFLDKAERYLLSLDQSDSTVKMALGAIYLDKQNYDKAIAAFEKSANLPPAELKLKYNSLGMAYIRKGMYAKAENILEIAVKIDPKDKYAHNNLGFVYAQQGKLEEARTHFAEALSIDRTYSNAEKNLLWVDRELRKRDKVK